VIPNVSGCAFLALVLIRSCCDVESKNLQEAGTAKHRASHPWPLKLWVEEFVDTTGQPKTISLRELGSRTFGIPPSIVYVILNHRLLLQPPFRGDPSELDSTTCSTIRSELSLRF
jgi:hypothetical protein